MSSKGHQVHASYHRWMLRDEERTRVLRAMVDALVRPGDVVADIGTGTGILALWARQAGASRVFAIDASSIVRLARQVAADNGVTAIDFIEGDARTVELPGPVDVVLSECLGNFAFSDAMFGAVGSFASRWLKPGGRRGPVEVRLVLQPADGRLSWDPFPFWKEPWQGLDLSAFIQAEANRMPVVDIVKSFLWDVPKQVLSFDPFDRADAYRLEGSWPIPEGKTVTGVVGWFEVDWAPGVTLKTSPSDPDTHWSQVLFPIPERIAQEGDSLEFEVDVVFDDAELPHYRWSGRWRTGAGEVLGAFARDEHALFGDERPADEAG